MWEFKYLIFTCIIHNIISENILDNEEFNKTNKQMFSDVLKNISIANQILQELVSNYEKLQKIYKSEDISKSQSSDYEVDPMFRYSSDSKQKQVRSKLEPFQGTAMIIDGSADEENEVTKAIIPEKSKSIYAQDKHIPTTEESSVDETESKEESEEIIIEPTQEKPTKTTPLVTKKITTSKRELELIRGGNTVKTRFDIKYKAQKFGLISPNEAPNYRRIRKVVYVESFSPDKIWEEVKNKPLRLNLKSASKNPDKRLALLFLKSKKKNKGNATNVNQRALDNEQKRQILRNSYGETCILVAVRKCFKAVKSVLKVVCKKGSSCKSSFKKTFNQFTKTSCIREFDYKKEQRKMKMEKKKEVKNGKVMLNDQRNEKDEEKKKEEKTYPITEASRKEAESAVFRNVGFESSESKDISNAKFVDLTRNNYLDTCITSMVSSKITLRDDIPEAELHKFNVLRDKYEKKCQQLSSKKCNLACQYTYTQTCSAHKCSRDRKKSFKKSCKKKCRSAYGVSNKSSSDSSDSNSESDSDSDSESTDKS